MFDCGLAGNLIVNNYNSTPTTYTVVVDGVSKNLLINAYETILLPCRDILDVSCSFCNLKLIPAPVGGFDETALLGLAGLLCGFILAYVIAKTAL